MPNFPRIFVNETAVFRSKFIVDDENTVSKVRKVLRLNVGDKLRLFDGKGNEYIGEIDVLTKNFMKGIVIEEIVNRKQEIGSDLPYVILAQALPRAGKLDDIIRMNTEVGVNEFIFFESDHSVVKLENLRDTKMDRWMKLAQEASRQSERNTLPIINTPTTFQEVLNIESDIKLLLHSKEVDDSKNIVDIKSQITKNSKILVVIGPEGGFSKGEVIKAQKTGFNTIYLNTPILRTETAGVVVCSYLIL